MNFDRKRQKIPFEIIILTDKRAETGRKFFKVAAVNFSYYIAIYCQLLTTDYKLFTAYFFSIFAPNSVRMAFAYIGLGTNLGDKERNLIDAIHALSLQVGRVVSQSTFYRSKSWGFESDNEFLNAVILTETKLSPFDLLAVTQKMERELGRTTKSGNGYADRIIDIDILLYDNVIVDELSLKIPHPLITERDFVLIPLVEIAPDLVNPMTGLKYSEIILPK